MKTINKAEAGVNSDGFISRYARILVVLGVICGATSGVLGKTITAPSLAIGFWRLTMGLPFFAIPVFLKEREELMMILTNTRKWHRSRRKKGSRSETLIEGLEAPGSAEGEEPGRRDLAFACFAGIFLFAHFFCWFNAVKLTNIASASILGALHPLVVVFISIAVYKKRIGIKQIAGITVAIIGACVTAGLDYSNLSQGHFTGDVFALMSAVCMGLYFALGEKGRENMSGSLYVFILFANCWFCFLIAMIVTGTPFFGYPPMDYILLVAMTILCQIGAHAIFNLCLGHVDSVYVSAWETADCVFASMFGFVLLHQVPTVWGIIGCILVVAGLLYYNFQESRQTPKE